MLYTRTVPALQRDRIQLFPSAEAARAGAGHDQPVLKVAIRHDAPGRRVISVMFDSSAFDPDWTAPAEYHADGSITAKGPIPSELFTL